MSDAPLPAADRGPTACVRACNFGIEVQVADGNLTRIKGDRDWLAGTPWHKNVPAWVEKAHA